MICGNLDSEGKQFEHKFNGEHCREDYVENVQSTVILLGLIVILQYKYSHTSIKRGIVGSKRI